MDDKIQKALKEIDERIASYDKWKKEQHPYAKGIKPSERERRFIIRNWTNDVCSNLHIIRNILQPDEKAMKK